MASTKGTRPGLSWPPDFNEIAQRMAKQDYRDWLEPKSGDLIYDVTFLQKRTAQAKNSKVRGIYARSTIVMSAATIEAITNDALATVYELLSDTIPFEISGEPPWVNFRGRSYRRIERLLLRGKFSKKRAYVLDLIYRRTGDELEKSVLDEIERVITFRNRIVHMNFQRKPNRHKALLNPAQAASIAAKAKECARDYLDFIGHNFSELKLPIRTIRSLWNLDDNLEDV